MGLDLPEELDELEEPDEGDGLRLRDFVLEDVGGRGAACFAGDAETLPSPSIWANLHLLPRLHEPRP